MAASKLKYLGHTWEYDGDTYSTQYKQDERFRITTWQFGDRHQSKVLIHYYGYEVGVGLAIQKTRNAAMKQGVKWTRAYLKKPLLTPAQAFKTAYHDWPDLFQHRLQVIDHLFFTIGNGHDWLDGVIINTSPEPRKYEKPSNKLEQFNKIMLRNLKARLAKEEGLGNNKAITDLLKYKEPDYKRIPAPTGPYNFYPVSNYSNICRVPDDVNYKWLRLAVEAAQLLKTRSDSASNKKCGTKILAELKVRFNRQYPKLFVKGKK